MKEKIIEDTGLLIEKLLKEKERKRKIVFTNGCFDLLHIGHIKLLKEAKRQGDILIVAINSDDSVKRLKGPGRPLFPVSERAEILASLEMVDYVTIFDTDDPYPIISKLKPDILVKGGDWEKEKIVGRDIVESTGGKVIRVPLLEGYSTSGIIQKIRNL